MNETGRGWYFAFEGPDGGGKTTVMRIIDEWLRDRGHAVHSTREPGGSNIGQRLRAILLEPAGEEKMLPLSSLFILSAARRQFLGNFLQPLLEAGSIVLSDRCFLSSLVYQAHGEGLPIEEVRTVCDIAIKGNVPDRIFLIDVDPDESVRRLRASGSEKSTRYDVMAKDFHQRVRNGYLYEANRNPGLIEVFDGSLQIRPLAEMLFVRILEIMQSAQPRA